MKELFRSLCVLTTLALFFSTHPHIALSGSQKPTVTVSVSVEEHTEPFVQVGLMEETQNGEAWTGYKEWKTVGTGKNDKPTQFTQVPYGSFSVFVDIDSCGGMRIGSFTFEKPIRTVEITQNNARSHLVLVSSFYKNPYGFFLKI